jgi:hypothetical protein
LQERRRCRAQFVLAAEDFMPSLRILLILLALALPAPACADGDPAFLAGVKDAANRLQLYFDTGTKAGTRPDFSKPPAPALFDRVFDLKQLAALPPPQPADVGWLLQWLAAANGAAKAILYFGVTLSNPPTADQIAAIKRNASDYEDQQETGFDFLIRLSARIMQTSVLFMSALPPEQRTPIREAGFERMKQGAAETIYGALVTVAQDKKPANARLVAAALNDTGAVWAKFLLPAHRAQIIQEVAEVQKRVNDSAAQDDLAMFSATLAAAK